MWSLISGLVVLSIMIIGACIGYVGAYKDRIASEKPWRDLIAYERRPAVTNDTSVKLGDQSESRVSVKISVSPRNLERVTDDMTDPPAYEDFSQPPPYEVAIASETFYEVVH